MYATITTPTDRAVFETLHEKFGLTAKTRVLQFIYLHGGGDSLTAELSYKSIALFLAHSVRHVKRVVRQLAEAGFIEVHRHQSATNGHHANRYTFGTILRSLLTPGDSPQQPSTAEPAEVSPSQPGDSPRPAPVPAVTASPEGDSPEARQASAAAHTDPPPGDSPQPEQPAEPQPSKPASQVTPNVVVVVNNADLEGLKNYYYETTGHQPSAHLGFHFKKWLKTFDRAYIEEKIDVLAEYSTHTPVSNPAGFLYTALQGDWKPNGPSLPKKGEDDDMDDEEWFLGGYQ